jgi:hypothetical protein
MVRWADSPKLLSGSISTLAKIWHPVVYRSIVSAALVGSKHCPERAPKEVEIKKVLLNQDGEVYP